MVVALVQCVLVVEVVLQQQESTFLNPNKMCCSPSYWMMMVMAILDGAWKGSEERKGGQKGQQVIAERR